jgi:hypothetical protein
MKKLQLFIVMLSFLWISNGIAGVFTVRPAFGINYSELECSMQSSPESLEGNIADITSQYPDFDPKFAPPSYNSIDVGTEDINLDTDIDTTDSAEGFEMNDRDVSLTSPAIKEIPVLIVRSIALKVFNFSPEVSRLRI